MSREQNKQNARRIFEEVMNRGNLQLVNELVADDYRLREPEGLPAGKEGMLTLVQAYRTAFPDLRTTVEDMIAEGDTVAVRWSGMGTQSGTFMGMPPSGAWVSRSWRSRGSGSRTGAWARNGRSCPASECPSRWRLPPGRRDGLSTFFPEGPGTPPPIGGRSPDSAVDTIADGGGTAGAGRLET